MYHIIIKLNTERGHIFLLLNHRRRQIVKVNNNQLGKAFTPISLLQHSRKHFIWDISLHRHISNLLSYKGEQYDILTSSYSDCFTVVMELVSLPLICIHHNKFPS